MAERGSHHLQCLALRDEDERLLPGLLPSWRVREQPLEAWVGQVHRRGPLAQIRFVRPEDGTECRTRCKGTADVLALLSLRDGIARRRAAHDGFDCCARLVPFRIESDGNGDAWRQAADVGAARRAGARWKRRAEREACFE